ncbi:hypothetical protein LCGC14_2132310 [marine sediment metagenome]|uniref:Uncharacterized protein n=1 Tax=marine sediment metagenome TaxID=412755 RepID=A0A0F9GX20_9ZZZZ
MTVEHRLVVGLQDIKAVTLVCKHCEGRYVMSKDISITVNCPICGATWLVVPTAVTRRVPSPFHDFVEALNALRIAQNHEDVGFRLLLEFDDPSSV